MAGQSSATPIERIGGPMRANVHRFIIANPGDVAELDKAILSGQIDPLDIVAVIGKTHGNGLVNDYTRGHLTLALSSLLARRTGESAEEITRRIPFIFSGGVEGVLTPHFTVFAASKDGGGDRDQPSLAIGVAFSEKLGPSDIGREAQIEATADAVRRATTQARIAAGADVHFVQVKCPAFAMDAIRSAKGPPPRGGPSQLMAFGRAAGALGVMRALGERPDRHIDESLVLSDFDVFSTVASVSAGIEIAATEVVVFGMSREWSGPLTIDHEPLKDALDIKGFYALAERLGLSPQPQVSRRDAERIRAAFVKCEADRSGMIRGNPHTMLNDGDIDQQRHIRGAVGAIAASVLNDTAIFVSGGAEQQGPDGGGLVAAIVDRT
jgi:cyanuric acid amidohydrolase